MSFSHYLKLSAPHYVWDSSKNDGFFSSLDPRETTQINHYRKAYKYFHQYMDGLHETLFVIFKEYSQMRHICNFMWPSSSNKTLCEFTFLILIGWKTIIKRRHPSSPETPTSKDIKVLDGPAPICSTNTKSSSWCNRYYRLLHFFQRGYFALALPFDWTYDLKFQ